MTMIYGWTSDTFSQDKPAVILKNMYVALGPLPKKIENKFFLGSHYAVGASSARACTWSYDEDGIFAVISGAVTERFRNSTKTNEIASRLIKNYRDKGNCCFNLLSGAFSAILYDSHTGKTLLAIDRAGISRLCYYTHANQVVFSSSITSLITSKSQNSAINHQAIYDYLYFHMIPAPDSIYEGIHKLLPGQCVTIDKFGISSEFYWEMPYREEGTNNIQTLGATFRSILSETIAPYINDTDIACFLSGGTDSSTLSGIYAQDAKHTLRTYSIGFNIPDYDETSYARIAADHFSTQHTVYYLTPADVVNAIPKIAAAYDEPFGNASAIPAYYCASIAAQDGITTMIGGDGGDELFAGNARYARQKLFEHYALLPQWIKNSLVKYIANNVTMRETPIIRKLSSYINQAKIPLPDRLESYNFLHRDAISNIFTTDYIQHIDQIKPLDLQREVYNRTDSPHSLNKMMHLDLKFTLADNDIRKVQTMCHLAGVDVNFPFLDERIMEFAASVPVTMQLKGQYLRYFFKTALKDLLPKEVIKKSKHGFGLPFGIWMREYKPLHELARDSLTMLAKRNIVRTEYIEQLWDRHENNDSAYYGVMIWILMMLEQWLYHHEK